MPKNVAEDKPIPVCGVRVFKKFRDQNPNITDCVCEPDHVGQHVYCVKVKQGIDNRSHALHFYGEKSRKILEPLIFFDMDGQQLETDQECAAMWQFWVLLREKRGRDS